MPHRLIERPDGPRPLPIRAARAGKRMSWAMRHGPADHKKKRNVLILIGAYADNGICDPSIRELAAKADLPPAHVVAIVDWLEQRGYVRVQRSDRERNRYELAMEAAV